MKRSASKFVLFAIAALLAAAPAKAATYNLDFDGDYFDIDAVVKTDAANNVVSISGSVLGLNGYQTSIESIVPTTSNLYGAYWWWNNLFTDNTPHVDWYGLLWKNIDGSFMNYYLDGGEIILSAANPTSGDFSHWQNGDTGTQSVSAVPLPAAAWLLGSGLMGLGLLGRKRKTATS